MEPDNNLILDIYESAQYCPASDFNEHALGKLKKSVAFDSAVLVDLAITPDKGFLIQSLHFHETPVGRFQDRHTVFGSEKFDRSGAISTRDLALKKAYDERGRSVVTDIERTFSDPETLQYLKKYETAHSLTFVGGRASAGTISAISLGRAGKKDSFQRKHTHAADLLLPHILQAKKINRQLASGLPAPAENSSTVLADFDGCMHFVDDHAVALLQIEWQQWTPPLLPQSLLASLKQGKERTFIGRAICVKASVQGKMICLVITRNSNHNARLSSAEYRVAELAAKGLQYKEIANQLGVAPATVRNQLHAVYGKLGISNKTALAKAL